MTNESTKRRPISESPWYWVYLFATAALIALIIMGPRYARRQSQIESQGIKRQRAAMIVRGKHLPPIEEVDDESDVDESEGTVITLRPLYVIMAGILSAAWAGLWLQHFRNKQGITDSSTSAALQNGDQP